MIYSSEIDIIVTNNIGKLPGMLGQEYYWVPSFCCWYHGFVPKKVRYNKVPYGAKEKGYVFNNCETCQLLCDKFNNYII